MTEGERGTGAVRPTTAEPPGGAGAPSWRRERRVTSSAAQRARGRQLDEHGQTGLLRHCLTTAIEITGRVETAWLQAGLDHALARHPALRATFPAGWEHHVIRPDLRVRIEARPVPGGSREQRWQQAVRFAYEDRMRPFDLARGPLVRATLLSTERRRHLLVLSFDQMVIDAQSAVVVVRELVATAHRWATGDRPPPPTPDAYVDLRAARRTWLATPEGREAVRARRAALTGATLGLPWTRMPDRSAPGDLAHHTVPLPDTVGTRLLRRARDLRVVPAAPSLAAFGLLLAAAGGHRPDRPDSAARHALTSLFAAREQPEEQDVVGWFANAVAVAVPPPRGTVTAYVRAAQRELMAALDAQRVSAARLDLPTGDDAGRITASLLYLPARLSGGDQEQMRIGDATARRLAVSFCPTGADLDLLVVEGTPRLTGERAVLTLGATSARDRVGRAQLTDLVTRWAEALTALAEVDWDRCQAHDLLERLPGTPPEPGTPAGGLT